MLIKYVLLALIGISSGIVIAGGFIAFISLIGIFERLAGQTNTGNMAITYENLIISGAVIGNIIYFFDVFVPVGVIGIVIFGLFAGGFVGCMAGALEEILNIFPIFSRRIALRKGLPFVIWAIAIGKLTGTLIQYIIF